MTAFESDKFDITNETGMVAYADGTFQSFIGNETSINMNVEGKTREGSTSTHNHPVDEGGLNTVFSLDDIGVMIHYNEYEKRMVTMEKGRKIVVRIHQTKNTTLANQMDFYSEVKKACTKMRTANRKEFRKYFNGEYKSKDDYYKKVYENVKIYEKVFVEKAKNYNLVFKKEYL